MNKIEIKEKNELTLSSNETKEIYLLTTDDSNKIINLNTNSHLIIYHYNIDKNVEIEINLNGENAEVEYHFSTINYTDHIFKMTINHHHKKTISNVFNHGVNVENNKLSFNVTGKVLKNIDGCICNQENQIINLKDGNSTILPNLLIDNYDVTSAHSAYIGKFRDDVLFYLMSRGLTLQKSNELLMKGLLINHGSSDKEEVIKFQEEIENI